MIAPRNQTRIDCHQTWVFHNVFGPMTATRYPTNAKQVVKASKCRGRAP